MLHSFQYLPYVVSSHIFKFYFWKYSPILSLFHVDGFFCAIGYISWVNYEGKFDGNVMDSNFRLYHLKKGSILLSGKLEYVM